MSNKNKCRELERSGNINYKSSRSVLNAIKNLFKIETINTIKAPIIISPLENRICSIKLLIADINIVAKSIALNVFMKINGLS